MNKYLDPVDEAHHVYYIIIFHSIFIHYEQLEYKRYETQCEAYHRYERNETQ